MFIAFCTNMIEDLMFVFNMYTKSPSVARYYGMFTNKLTFKEMLLLTSYQTPKCCILLLSPIIRHFISFSGSSGRNPRMSLTLVKFPTP